MYKKFKNNKKKFNRLKNLKKKCEIHILNYKQLIKIQLN